MKKFIYTIIALLGIMMPNTAWAQTTAGDEGSKNDWHYTVNEDGTATIVCFKHWHKHGDQDTEAYCHCYSGDAVIPSTIDGYTVTAIGKECFSYCAITSVTIPSTVKLIDEAAFYQCAAITEITIPASVDSIASGPFIGSPIEKLAIDDSPNVLKLHTNVDFRGMNSLKTLYIGRNLNYPVTPSIGRTLFWGTVALESLTFGDYVTEIQEATFRLCPELKEVIFGSNMTSIGDYAFSQCENLISADLPYGLTYIGKSAFSHCKALPSPRFPETLTLIDDGAYSQCEAITEITIPASVDSIASGPFSGCSIEKLTIDDSPNVLKLHTSVDFRGLNSLKTLYIGRNLNYPVTPSIGRTLFWGTAELESLTFGDHVTDIAEATFRLCPKLKEVTFSPNMTYISDYAFSECESLVSADLPYGLTYIGKYAFSHCKALPSPRFPETLTLIDDGAYSQCEAITEITIPASVDSIASGPFSGCPIEKLTIDDSPNVLKLHTSVDFRGLNSLKTLYIGRNLNYPVTPSIGRTLFWGTAELESLTFGDHVTDIAEATFRLCPKLKEVTFSPNMTYISDYAFSECESLVSADLQYGLKSIGKSAFYKTSIDTLRLPQTVEDLGYSSFAFTQNLSTIYSDNPTPPACDGMVFDGNDNWKDKTVYVPAKSLDAYKEATCWKEFFNILPQGEAGYEQVATPTWTFQNEMLALSTETADASIYYATANWENEAETDSIANTINVSTRSTLYQNPIEITDNIIIKMIAAKEGMENSEVATFVYDYKSWKELYETVTAGAELLSKAQDSGKVDEGLLEELKWALNEGDMMYQRRAEMSNQEAKYFTDAIVNICIKIKEQMDSESHQDGDIITEETVEGVWLKYLIISESEKTCQVGTIIPGDDNFGSEDLANATDTSTVGTITIPEEVKGYRVIGIGKYAFQHCEKITNVSLSKYIKYIGESAFGYMKIPSISLSDAESLEKIYGGAFECCNELTSIIIPSTVIHIGYNPIYDCSSLESVIVEKDNTIFDSRDNCNAIIETEANRLLAGCKTSTIPYGVEELYYGAFLACRELKSIEIPNTVRIINTQALNSTGITSITLPESLEEIGYAAFAGSELTSITIPANVKVIRNHAFASINELMSVTSEIVSPFEIENDVFSEDTYEKGTLYVPANSIQAYNNTPAWSNFRNVKEIGESTATATYENFVLTVDGNTSMAQALEQVGGREEVAKNIAAIIWNSSETLTRSDIEGFGNPNLLIYVQTESQAPEGVNNVVIDGKAKSITLVDAEGNNNFWAPQDFVAESISYTREFKQTTEKDVSRGWEGICLPFTVQKFTHESHGEITPFGNDASIFHFWLHQMTDKGMVNATTIEANKPYIISMPNNGSYPEAYNQAGKVTFSAQNATVSTELTSYLLDKNEDLMGIASDVVESSDSSLFMASTFIKIEAYEYIYTLNVGHEIDGYAEGSVFVKNYRDVKPFEVFTVHKTDFNEEAGARPQYISVSSLFGGDGDATGFIDVRQPADNDNVKVYSLNGTLLKQGKRNEVMNTLPKGVYIINNKKMVVK